MSQLENLSLVEKLEMMQALASDLLYSYPDGSTEKSYATLILMELAVLTGERMSPPKRDAKQSKRLQSNESLWTPKSPNRLAREAVEAQAKDELSFFDDEGGLG